MRRLPAVYCLEESRGLRLMVTGVVGAMMSGGVPAVILIDVIVGVNEASMVGAVGNANDVDMGGSVKVITVVMSDDELDGAFVAGGEDIGGGNKLVGVVVSVGGVCIARFDDGMIGVVVNGDDVGGCTRVIAGALAGVGMGGGTELVRTAVAGGEVIGGCELIGVVVAGSEGFAVAEAGAILALLGAVL